MFANVRRCVEAGGARVEDIIKVTFWMKELQRKPVNDEWVKMFPDPASRPARQIMEVPMEPEVLVECDFMAVIESRPAMKFGVTLSNRGVLVGLCTTADLLRLADAVEASPLMDWSGAATRCSSTGGSTRSRCWRRWPGAPSGCCSGRPAWARSRSATRWCSPMNGPRST